MKIEHLAIWVDDIELMRSFYTTYFGMTSNQKYVTPTKNYTSYFLSTAGSSCRLELMNRPDVCPGPSKRGFSKGLAHFALTVGTPKMVDALTETLRQAGYTIASETRLSGDGYYESAVLDPEQNLIELIAEKNSN